MFSKEEKILKEAQELLSEKTASSEALVHSMELLTKNYENLLKDSKFLAKIGDRLQYRIVKTNHQLRGAKQDLEEKVKQRTAELEQTNQMLIAANNELDNFVYRASHDIKGPISRLLGICQVGIIDIQDPAGIAYLQKVEYVAETMDGALDLLLSVNNLKKLLPEPSVFEITPLIAKAFRVAKEGVGDVNIQLDIRGKEIGDVCSDEKIFTILMENLFSYATKSIVEARGTQSETVTISVRISVKDNLIIKIQLSFNGTALPIEVLEKVFDMFYRTLNHKFHTGLELYASQLAAEKLGGDVQLLKSETQETIFGIVLPFDMPIK